MPAPASQGRVCTILKITTSETFPDEKGNSGCRGGKCRIQQSPKLPTAAFTLLAEQKAHPEWRRKMVMRRGTPEEAGGGALVRLRPSTPPCLMNPRDGIPAYCRGAIKAHALCSLPESAWNCCPPCAVSLGLGQKFLALFSAGASLTPSLSVLTTCWLQLKSLNEAWPALQFFLDSAFLLQLWIQELSSVTEQSECILCFKRTVYVKTNEK